MKKINFRFIIIHKYIVQLSKIFKDLEININTVPVLDILYKTTSKFLVDEFSSNVNTIKALGKICTNEFRKNKIYRYKAYTWTWIIHCYNKKLPIIKKDLKHLIKYDFNCFKNINSHFAMTAHILYKKIDKNNCATHSKTIIKNIIRKEIKFKVLQFRMIMV